MNNFILVLAGLTATSGTALVINDVITSSDSIPANTYTVQRTVDGSELQPATGSLYYQDTGNIGTSMVGAGFNQLSTPDAKLQLQ